MLAGLVKAPSAYNPADASKLLNALDRRQYVLDQMVKMKYVTQEQAVAARDAKVTIVGQRTPEDCTLVQQAQLGAGFFCDFFYRWWLDNPAFGADQYERRNRLKSGGSSMAATCSSRSFTCPSQ